MRKIKLTIHSGNTKCNRQLPNGGLVWKGYEFIINQPCEEADYWVVYSKANQEAETCKVAPENTLLIIGEPDSVYHYAQKYVNQFAKVLSCQQKLKHKNLVIGQCAMPWHIGRFSLRTGDIGKETKSAAEFSHNYDDLKKSKPQKTKLMSVITSNKSFTKGHRERIDFVLKLKEHYGEKLDMFGWGFNNFENKWDVIAPYKYHIVLENNSIPHYWTEKLADAYLGNSFPFYYGAPNVGDYFSKESFLQIDIHNVEKAIQIIDNAIAEDIASKNADSVEEAKMLVLDKYNLFNVIVEQIQDMNPEAPKQQLTIKHDRAFIDIRKYILGCNRVMNKICSKIVG